MINILKKLIFITAVFICPFATIAQLKKNAKDAVKPVAKFKQPKLYTSLGQFKDTAYVTEKEAEDAIALPLKVMDDKKNEYTISSYQFLYKKKAVTEDEQTGKVSPTTSISSDRFKTTPLPPLWINVIQEQVKPGEEFFFFDVIAKDPQGRVMTASSLKLIVK